MKLTSSIGLIYPENAANNANATMISNQLVERFGFVFNRCHNDG